MSSREERKRPPPITIPPPQALRMPGPNAFAVASYLQQDEPDMQYKPPRPASSGQAMSSRERSAPLHPPAVQAGASNSLSSSAMTTITQLLEAARGTSPQKSDSYASVTSRHGSTARSRYSDRSFEAPHGNSPQKSGSYASANSRHGSTARSRHSNKSSKSHASAGSSDRKPWEMGRNSADMPSSRNSDVQDRRSNMSKIEEEKTVRADIEDRAEKKYFKLMGQALKGKRAQTGLPKVTFAKLPEPGDSPVRVEKAGHYIDASTEGSEKKNDLPKSPKKKLFGMSMPTFGRSGSSAIVPTAPPMPAKAAEILGTVSSVNKRRDVPSQPWRPPPRSDTSKSLPAALQESHLHNQSRPAHQRSNPSKSRNQTPNRKTKAAQKPHGQNNDRKRHVSSSSEQGFPPTPPEKDTPRDMTENKFLTRAHGKAGEEESPVQMPPFRRSTKRGSSQSVSGPTTFHSGTAEEYAQLVQQPRVLSTHVEVDTAAVELEGSAPYLLFKGDDAEQQERYPQWWLEGRQKQVADAEDEAAPLLPRFYSPSIFAPSLFEGGRPSQNADPKRYLFILPSRRGSHASNSDSEHGSIPIVFQGDISEIDPSSNTAHAIKAAIDLQRRQAVMSSGGTGSQGRTPNLPNSVHSKVNGEQQEHSGDGEQRGTALENPEPEQSSSKPSYRDILARPHAPKEASKEARTRRAFRPSCPSAVPSPLRPASSMSRTNPGTDQALPSTAPTPPDAPSSGPPGGTPAPSAPSDVLASTGPRAPTGISAPGALSIPPGHFGHLGQFPPPHPPAGLPPAPLDHGIPHYAFDAAETPGDGSDTSPDFHRVHTHIGLSSEWLVRTIDDATSEARDAAMATAGKLEEILSRQEECSKNVSSAMTGAAVVEGHILERVLPGIETVNRNVEGLMEYIKEGVAEPVTRLTTRSIELQKQVETLQANIQQLQKLVMNSQKHQNPGSSAMGTFRLPGLISSQDLDLQNRGSSAMANPSLPGLGRDGAFGEQVRALANLAGDRSSGRRFPASTTDGDDNQEANPAFLSQYPSEASPARRTNVRYNPWNSPNNQGNGANFGYGNPR